MKSYIKTKGLYLFIAAFSFVSISACDSTSSEDEAPDVIPSEVFALPVDLFNQSAAKDAMPGANFTAAALRVWPVSLIISANLVIPSLTTLSALQAEPIFEDGAWTWTSTVNSGGEQVQFTLLAERFGDGTSWSMRLSSSDTTSGVFNNFELFSAETSDNGEMGSWQLNYPVNGVSQNVLNATYTITSDTEKSITFNVPQTAQSAAGDSVEYTENGDERTFLWQQVAESIMHTITWNATTLEGTIDATNFNGGTMGCWDANLDDIACSPS